MVAFRCHRLVQGKHQFDQILDCFLRQLLLHRPPWNFHIEKSSPRLLNQFGDLLSSL